MPKFAVAIKDFNGDMDIQFIEAEDEIDALRQGIVSLAGDDFDQSELPDTDDEEELRQFAWDMDSDVLAKQIP